MLVLPLLPVSPFCKLFRWDDIPLKGLVHHLFCKHKLVEPVIIGLREADCPHLIYVNVPKHLFKKNCEPISPPGKGYAGGSGQC
jgi:hypothetical protein